jgi:hypothetical protein
MTKRFAKDAADIELLVPGTAACIASDRITVDGAPVGYMYREHGSYPIDTGWTFLAGDESEEYLSDASNAEVYMVNTIANYDPSIIPLLHAPVGSAFIRDPETGLLTPLSPEISN